MSTLIGQSDLQPLHERHKSSASKTSSDFHPSVMTSPCNISNRIRERPRVECSSSRNVWYDGHITWPPSVRHLPTPTHRSVACASDPSSSGKAKCVLGFAGL